MLHSELCLASSSPLQTFFFPLCAKDVWFRLRHWTDNQQDLKVGLGFLHAVISCVPLRHITPSGKAITSWLPVFGGERKKPYEQMDSCALFYLSFYFASQKINSEQYVITDTASYLLRGYVTHPFIIFRSFVSPMGSSVSLRTPEGNKPENSHRHWPWK